MTPDSTVENTLSPVDSVAEPQVLAMRVTHT